MVGADLESLRGQLRQRTMELETARVEVGRAAAEAAAAVQSAGAAVAAQGDESQTAARAKEAACKFSPRRLPPSTPPHR
jgi:hypothetical protein